MAEGLRIRRYDPHDADPVWTLHETALRDAGTDPADVPGTDDLQRIEAAYLDAGGDFLVGLVPSSEVGAGADGPAVGRADGDGDRERRRAPRTDDGALVAMGGFVPNEAGHADERTIAGAAELHRMRVAPTHQRRGYGRALLVALEERAANRGFDVVLATTARRQSAAVAFYREEGYEPIGESTEAGYRLIHFEKEL